MEVHAVQPPSSGSSAAAYPRWVMLSPLGDCETARSYSAADAKTVVTARTSTGHPIGVSLHLAAPPAASRVCVHFPHSFEHNYATVVAAHGDSMLINTVFKEGWPIYKRTTDYFVYNAGAAAPPRPPSLSLLPPYYLTEEESDEYDRLRGPVNRQLDDNATGILRRGEDEVVVAELKIVEEEDAQSPKAPELLLLRCGEWSTKQPAISHDDGKYGELLSSWTTHTVVTIGDGVLCWVDLSRGLMFSDVFEECPALRYVPLPAAPHYGRNVCVTAGGAVKFVNVFPRCCCGSAGATKCHHSDNAYTINTWTLRMGDMVWVMDGMVDATELWALDAYKGLPRVRLGYPVVSMDDPHIICFVLCESYYVKDGDNTERLIMVDTRSKTVLSVYRYPNVRCYYRGDFLLPSRVSDFFNPYPSRNNGTSLASTRDVNTEPPPVAVEDKQVTDSDNSSVLQSSLKSSPEPMRVSKVVASPEETILAALEEIPSFAREDMLKAYSILSHDSSGRRFRSLLGLPVSLRKDWLLMEIKASEACSICSACAADLQHA